MSPGKMNQAGRLDALLARVRACRLCEAVLEPGPRPVLQAHADARILIASQAPGRRVHRTGIPFDDPSGDRLRDWLGVDRATFYDPRVFAILPMGFCYPGRGRSGDLPPRPECARTWRQQLLAELPRLELTVVIGAWALRYHLPGARSVTAAVQDWRAHWPRLLPLPHPSPRNIAWFRANPWFDDEVLPALRSRVEEVVRSASGSGRAPRGARPDGAVTPSRAAR